MKVEIEVRTMSDGRLQARRSDGHPLTPEDRESVLGLVELAPRKSTQWEDRAFIDGSIVAVQINSPIVGGLIWLAFSDGWHPNQDDTTPIFFASELPSPRFMTEAELRRQYELKRKFGGGWIRDRDKRQEKDPK